MGHVEEKNDRQVGPSHTNMLIMNHFSGPAYWSLFMWMLKADWWPPLSKCLSGLRADIYQGNLNYSKQCWSLCLSFQTPPHLLCSATDCSLSLVNSSEKQSRFQSRGTTASWAKRTTIKKTPLRKIHRKQRPRPSKLFLPGPTSPD